ncbi:PEP-CTERM sorting domain-containing protein [Cerasicoccus arenae]|uniref:PEP-CTERM protein-sorting domain-containing protein n=1 Tax=Cerasicoccus arenae TaxID=424488 RepID=A0A8J3D982_9BACT|nr:PEP-CTERM sorting domain-containing protein [Cerasicoccus arenae]MBK1858290.1 PEP-CTERM sorting domain-containing protein [Cerasicoccus arenae]GHB90562.1 hypothetical protein GCM10007047_01660 [Cerasicoccus arenae]
MKNEALPLTKFRGYILALTIGAALAPQLSASQSYTTPGDTLSQDFNAGLPSGASTETWTDDSVFSGWSVYQFATDSAPSDYRITSGNSSGIQLFQWRTSASAINGALGTKPATDSGSMIMYLELVNNTGIELISFSLGYIGEQWYDSDSGQNNQLIVSYQVGATDATSGTWTDIDALDFDSIYDGTDLGDLDGTLPENQTVFSPEIVSNIGWSQGETLIIRWFDSNSTGVDQGLAIDDVNFAAVPEPSQYAMIFALMALVLGVLRRRSI